ncbi:LPD1 domain-containing protein [Iodobacter sp. CM08]|uniref:LPD1 domain-containing protein n=1 Tax=Iodobacter sp. CM08 TaxID=3085902 RepID=UPI00298143E2|nr:LPD1 domain-containing protein [Iodobacter sp. CM08]MDW5418758.1 LPD1 domain-containing protein [Iodobacter sp. CM08]
MQTYPWPDLSKYGARLTAEIDQSTGVGYLHIHVNNMTKFALHAGYFDKINADLLNNNFTNLLNKDDEEVSFKVMNYDNYNPGNSPHRILIEGVTNTVFDFYDPVLPDGQPLDEQSFDIRTDRIEGNVNTLIKSLISSFDEENDVKLMSMDEVRQPCATAPNSVLKRIIENGQWSPFRQDKILYVIKEKIPSLNFYGEKTLQFIDSSNADGLTVNAQLVRQQWLNVSLNFNNALDKVKYKKGMVFGYEREADAKIASFELQTTYEAIEYPTAYLTHMKMDKHGAWMLGGFANCHNLMNERGRILPDPLSNSAMSDSTIAAFARARANVFLDWSDNQDESYNSKYSLNLQRLEAALKSISGFNPDELHSNGYVKSQISNLIESIELVSSYTNQFKTNEVINKLLSTDMLQGFYSSKTSSMFALESLINAGIIEDRNECEALSLVPSDLARFDKIEASIPELKELLASHVQAIPTLEDLVTAHTGPESLERKDAGEKIYGAHKDRFIGRFDVSKINETALPDLIKLANLKKIWPLEDDLLNKVKSGPADLTTMLLIHELRNNIPTSLEYSASNVTRRQQANHKLTLESNDNYAQKVASAYILVVSDLRDAVEMATTKQEFYKGLYEFSQKYNLPHYKNFAEVKTELSNEENNELKQKLIYALGNKFFRTISAPTINYCPNSTTEEYKNRSDGYRHNSRLAISIGISRAVKKVIDQPPMGVDKDDLIFTIKRLRDSLFENLEKYLKTDNPLSDYVAKCICLNFGLGVKELNLSTSNARNPGSAGKTGEGEEKLPRYSRPHIDHLVQSTDWLQEKLADENLFMQAFGLKAVQYGNWLSSKSTASEAQQVLQYAFNSLADLASLLKIPSQAIGFNTNLSIAFASRGIPNAQAHYEIADEIINLSRYNGAGSLCHEWAHGLSHYIAKIGGASKRSCLGDQINFISRNSSWEPIALDYARFMNSLQYNLKQDGTINRHSPTEYFDRCLKQDGGEKNKKPYWSTAEEMCARFFETYIEKRLIENGHRSQYLVHSTQKGHLYPEGKELDKFINDFENFFNKYREKIIENAIKNSEKVYKKAQEVTLEL